LRTKAATLKPEQLATLDRVEAQAFATAGKRDQAIAAFGKLVGKYPQDGAIQEAFAQLLSQGTERKEWETGLGQWRKIAARSQPQSARWYRAKYAVADLQQRLGDAPAAVQLIRYLQETPPGLPAEWQGPFEQLLKKCER
jgi:tetratricopeptide (TPR) repeat protein